MAKKSEKQTKNFFDKVKKFFAGIYSELKLVVWPNQKTFKQAVGTVFTLCIIAGLLIFFVDTFMKIVLDVVGFNSPGNKVHTVVTEEQETESTLTITEPISESSESQTQDSASEESESSAAETSEAATSVSSEIEQTSVAESSAAN